MLYIDSKNVMKGLMCIEGQSMLILIIAYHISRSYRLFECYTRPLTSAYLPETNNSFEI